MILAAAGGRQTGRNDGLVVRRVVAATAALAALIVVLVSVAGLLVSRGVAERQTVHDVAELTYTLAHSVVQPALTNGMETDPTAAARVLDPIIRERVLSRSLVRVKLWSPGGTVLYSNERRLIGTRLPLDADAAEAFAHPHVQAGITDLHSPENRFERKQGKLLEVYQPIWTPGGAPLLFESYFRYDMVAARSHELWRGFAGIMLSSVAALALLLIPLAWLVVIRARHARDEREGLIQRALATSEDERRRIAGSLHDGVVQQLAAASFATAGYAEQVAAGGDAALADGLRSTAATVRDGIAGLRSLLVDIYPPSLRESGLEPALHDVARSVSGSQATVAVDVDTEAAALLPVDTRAAIFQVAQEAVRNAVRHGRARRISIRLSHDESGAVHLKIADDGVGFDATSTTSTAQGHFGLRLMADAARSCAASLAVSSSTGGGTRLLMTIASV